MLKIYFFSSTLIKLKTYTSQKKEHIIHYLISILGQQKVDDLPINNQKIELELN